MNTSHVSRIRSRHLPHGLLAAALMLAAGWAQAVDWGGVPATDVPLFYPGQASWEWVMTEKDHSGAPNFRSGKNCKACHDGEQGDIGNAIVSGKILAPAPVAGRPGKISLHVQTARDAERLYFRLRWKAGSGAPALDADTAARVTVMIDDGTVKEAARAGCWGSCHDDSIGMASASADGRTTKYLSASRSKLTRQGGGENIKPAADLAALKSSGAFLEYWQAKVNPGQPAKAVSGYILDKRHETTGTAVAADATFEGGDWTVVLSRPLVAAGEGSKSIVAGKTYHIGFAVHDDHADHRHHHVSFEYTLALDGSGSDFVARAK